MKASKIFTDIFLRDAIPCGKHQKKTPQALLLKQFVFEVAATDMRYFVMSKCWRILFHKKNIEKYLELPVSLSHVELFRNIGEFGAKIYFTDHQTTNTTSGLFF